MVLVDEAMAVEFPDILPSASRARLLRRYKNMPSDKGKKKGRRGGVV